MSGATRTVDLVDAIRIARELDLPRGIVWEALVDADLVSGWLHPVHRLVTGTSPVEFREPDDPAAPAVLEVISPSFGDVRIALIRLDGGTRGESTRLELSVSDEWGRRSEREALWALRLEQLHALLRGHPVDWGSWPRRHRAAEPAPCRARGPRAAGASREGTPTGPAPLAPDRLRFAPLMDPPEPGAAPWPVSSST